MGTEQNESLAIEELREKMADQMWRLSNLYYIVDERGEEVLFRPNWAQRKLFREFDYRNIILKARQLGVSTFILLLILDTCLFNSNTTAGVIAHTRDDAKKLFRTKIKYPYDRLPDWLKEARPAKLDSQQELVFENGSSITVSTSIRSGTAQILHISEFGKICAKYPHKAEEIVTGSLRAVHPGQMVFMESTAEGREGYFYDYCKQAKRLQDIGAEIGKMDFKLHFLPWWKHPQNTLDPSNLIIIPRMQQYFAQLEARNGIRLTNAQKAWYIAQESTAGTKVKREDPSTFEEAFEAVVEGAYYASAMTKARQDGRVTRVPYQQGVLIDTYWDLGVNDRTCIWFVQQIGQSYNIIDFYQNQGEGIQFYVDVLAQWREDKGYRYGRHVWPHDGHQRDFGTGKARDEVAAGMGLDVNCLPQLSLQDGIEAVRNLLSVCWFDEEHCEEGLIALEEYRKEWDEIRGEWKKNPRHDWASHPADAFRTFAMAQGQFNERRDRRVRGRRPIHVKSATGWT